MLKWEVDDVKTSSGRRMSGNPRVGRVGDGMISGEQTKNDEQETENKGKHESNPKGKNEITEKEIRTKEKGGLAGGAGDCQVVDVLQDWNLGRLGARRSVSDSNS